MRRGWGSQGQTLALGSAGYLLVVENIMRFDLSSLGVDGKVPPGVSRHYQVPQQGATPTFHAKIFKFSHFLSKYIIAEKNKVDGMKLYF